MNFFSIGKIIVFFIFIRNYRTNSADHFICVLVLCTSAFAMLPNDIEFILQICLPGGAQKTALLDNSYVMVSFDSV